MRGPRGHREACRTQPSSIPGREQWHNNNNAVPHSQQCTLITDALPRFIPKNIRVFLLVQKIAHLFEKDVGLHFAKLITCLLTLIFYLFTGKCTHEEYLCKDKISSSLINYFIINEFCCQVRTVSCSLTTPLTSVIM